MCQLGSWESSYSFLPSIAGRNPLLILVLDPKLKYDVCLDSFYTAWTYIAQPFSRNYRSSWNLKSHWSCSTRRLACGLALTAFCIWASFLSHYLFSMGDSWGCHLFCLNHLFLSMDFFPRTFEGFPWALLIPIPPSCHPFSLAHLELVQVCPSANRPYSGLLSTFSSLQACGLPWRAGCKIRECLAASKC